MTNRLHGIIFAYRSNPQLRELSQHRNTCSIPYGGRYRIVDFMLSNMVNAGISDVGLIVHANYQSLLDHVGSGDHFHAWLHSLGENPMQEAWTSHTLLSSEFL